MYKYLAMFVILVSLASCQAVAKSRILNISQNFDYEIENIVEEISSTEDEEIGKIGGFLKNCETGFITHEGFKVENAKNRDTCIILLLKDEEKESFPLFQQFLRSNGSFTVAATMDVVGPEYPFIIIPEGEFDRDYFVRVLVHEGFHAFRLQTQATGPDLQEEELAYKLQFKVLTSQFSSAEIEEGTHIPEGMPEYAVNALEMERDLYREDLKGAGYLYQYLMDIGYGE